MAFSTFVFLTLLNLALSLPEPDPNVKVVVDVEVDDRGCGCCDNKCCTYDGVKYRSGYNLIVGCVELCCKRDGEWEFKGIIPSCGNCTVGGEPWVRTFDPVDGQLSYNGNNLMFYRTNRNGSHHYVLTQEGTAIVPNFGVSGHFCFRNKWGPTQGTHGPGSYLDSITYKEDSIKIKWTCEPGCGDPNDITQPCTKFMLKGPFDTVTHSSAFPFSHGGIWFFKDGDCIIIVGTKGLTVVVCMRVRTPVGGPNYDDLPYVYIYPSKIPPSSLTNELYGICNNFTGTGDTADEYTGRYYSDSYRATDCNLGGYGYDIDALCSKFMDSWKAIW